MPATFPESSFFTIRVCSQLRQDMLSLQNLHQAAKIQIDVEVLVPQESKNTLVCKEIFKRETRVYHTCVLCMHLQNREGGWGRQRLGSGGWEQQRSWEGRVRCQEPIHIWRWTKELELIRVWQASIASEMLHYFCHSAHFATLWQQDIIAASSKLCCKQITCKR